MQHVNTSYLSTIFFFFSPLSTLFTPLTDFSNVKALRILNSELADTLGNLLSRACAKSLNPRQVYPRLHAVQLDDLLRMDATKRLQDALQQIEGSALIHTQHKGTHTQSYYIHTEILYTLILSALGLFALASKGSARNLLIILLAASLMGIGGGRVSVSVASVFFFYYSLMLRIGFLRLKRCTTVQWKMKFMYLFLKVKNSETI